ncbi:MAG TPA: lipopolysaccharide transport periplasmic protein LptA [Rudaea sp.]|nr:lipopolysaccharide transport periplasmic protein LptA [Rudaea sp.]
MNTVHRKAAVRFVSGLIVSGMFVLLATQQAWSLSSDNDQPMDVTANTSKSVASKTGAANDPDITDLDGNVIITRGSIKIHADHARVYQIPSGAKDPNAGKYSHIVLTGKPAHMQQLHDGDCGLMTADANTIDYKPPTNLAELTGGVKVVQAGRGESHSEHMLYNTDTGEMEAGDSSASSRVHMIMQPGTAKLPERSDNCGFPGAPKAKAAKAPAGEKPAH